MAGRGQQWEATGSNESKGSEGSHAAEEKIGEIERGCQDCKQHEQTERHQDGDWRGCSPCCQAAVLRYRGPLMRGFQEAGVHRLTLYTLAVGCLASAGVKLVRPCQK